jgi:hypothetical protein
MAELARIQRAELVSTFDEAARAAKAMAGSGYFQDAKAVEQAMVKIMAGHEMGFGPFASMTGIHVISGKPTVGANLMAAAVKAHPVYDYRVRKMENDEVVLEFFAHGESLGVSSFNKDDAKAANTKNISAFPRNMLFARAMSNGVRWYCPDVFNGSAVYTPEELGADVDEDGRVVDAPVREVRPAPVVQPARTPVQIVDADPGPDFEDGSPGEPAEAPKPVEIPSTTPQRPYDPWTLAGLIEESIIKRREQRDTLGPRRENMRGAVVVNLESCFAQHSDQARHVVSKYLTGKASSKEWDDAEIMALHRWLGATEQSGAWVVNPDSVKEAHAAYAEAMRELGQQSLFETGNGAAQ